MISFVSRVYVGLVLVTKSKINTCSKGSTINNTSSINTSNTTSSNKGITSYFYNARTELNRKNGKRKLVEIHDVI